MRAAWSRKTSPAAVRRTRRLLRSTSWAPSSSDRRLLLNELLHCPVHGIRNVDVALGAYSDKMSLAELAHAISRLAHGGQDVAVQIQPQKLPRESIHHVNVFRSDVQSARQAGV